LSRIRSGSCASRTIDIANTAAASAVNAQVRAQATTRATGRVSGAAGDGTPYLEVGGGAQTDGAGSAHPGMGGGCSACGVPGCGGVGSGAADDGPGSKGGGQTGLVAGWVTADREPSGIALPWNHRRALPSHSVPTAAATADET
jgi:hypothetical protein